MKHIKSFNESFFSKLMFKADKLIDKMSQLSADDIKHSWTPSTGDIYKFSIDGDVYSVEKYQDTYKLFKNEEPSLYKRDTPILTDGKAKDIFMLASELCPGISDIRSPFGRR